MLTMCTRIKFRIMSDLRIRRKPDLFNISEIIIVSNYPHYIRSDRLNRRKSGIFGISEIIYPHYIRSVRLTRRKSGIFGISEIRSVTLYNFVNMQGLRFSNAMALFFSISAMLLSVLGIFLRCWWVDVTDVEMTYGLFTVIQCEDNLCSIGEHSTEGWLVFIQVMALSQFILLVATVLFQAAGLVTGTMWLIIAASGALGWSCTSSVLQMSVIGPTYMKLTRAYQTVYQTGHYKLTSTQLDNYVIYQTLPVALCLISGSLCIPGFIFLFIYRTEERRTRFKPSNIA